MQKPLEGTPIHYVVFVRRDLLWDWSCAPVTTVLWRRRQEDLEFQSGLDHIHSNLSSQENRG